MVVAGTVAAATAAEVREAALRGPGGSGALAAVTNHEGGGAGATPAACDRNGGVG